MSTLVQSFSDVVFWSNVLTFIFVSIAGCVWAIFAHEMSHVLLAAKFRIKKNLAWWKIKPYPHYDDRLGHVWASAHWMWNKSFKITSRLRASTMLGPWLPRTICLILFGLSPVVFDKCFLIFVTAFLVPSIVDSIVGCIGSSDMSDIQRAAKYLDINVNWIRLPGILLIATSIATFAYMLFECGIC